MSCVRQLDHAALSGLLAASWGGPHVPELVPSNSVVLAAGRHDAGWPELDEEPRLDPERGQPYTYVSYPVEERIGVARRSVGRVSAEDPYSGWLVSRHFASFHIDSPDPEALTWVTEQVGRRATLLARARPLVPEEALHPHVLEANFDWLQLLDALSLALCNDWESWDSRSMAMSYGERNGHWRYERERSGVLEVVGRVSPWPFEAESVTGRFPARVLEGERWEGKEDLAKAWRDGTEVMVEVELGAA
jgi:hypothetical protein